MTSFGVDFSPEATRHGSVPAHPIALADGRSWGLALPAPRYRPEVVSSVDSLGRTTATTRLVARVGYPPVIEPLIDELRSACGTDATAVGDQRRFDALMALAVALLRRAHNLSLDAAIGLLDLDSDGLIHLVDVVTTIVAGCQPPDSGAGSNLSPAGGGYAPHP